MLYVCIDPSILPADTGLYNEPQRGDGGYGQRGQRGDDFRLQGPPGMYVCLKHTLSKYLCIKPSMIVDYKYPQVRVYTILCMYVLCI
jgi:hypothetical protein